MADVVSSVDGAFTAAMNSIDMGPTKSPQFLLAQLQITLSEQAKQGALDYIDKIQAQQDEQAEVAEFIRQARELQEQADAGDKTTTMPAEMKAFMQEHGLTWDQAGNDDEHYADEWDVAIQSLQNYQETLGTSIQTDMVFVNDYMGQYESYLQGASSTISSATQMLTNIARGQ